MKNLIPIAIGSRSGCFARRISLSIVSNGKELRLDHDWNLGRSPKSTKRQVRTRPWTFSLPWPRTRRNLPRGIVIKDLRSSSHDDCFHEFVVWYQLEFRELIQLFVDGIFCKGIFTPIVRCWHFNEPIRVHIYLTTVKTFPSTKNMPSTYHSLYRSCVVNQAVYHKSMPNRLS